MLGPVAPASVLCGSTRDGDVGRDPAWAMAVRAARGIAGRVVGWVMAHRNSNVERNRWVVSLLEVQPADRVLEIGFGPGVAITELAARATQGQVYGIDHSQVMVEQASRRNAAAIRAG